MKYLLLLLALILTTAQANLMENVEFNSRTYNDDRMYVFYIAPCTEEIEGEYVHYQIYHNNPPTEHKWCLVTYRNTERYPVSRLDAFDTKTEVQKYQRRVEPTTPLVSLGGEQSGMSYDRFVDWKNQQGLQEYDYKKMYLPGGENHREMITIKRR